MQPIPGVLRMGNLDKLLVLKQDKPGESAR